MLALDTHLLVYFQAHVEVAHSCFAHEQAFYGN